jgi:Fe-coproporphyrin III synthase
VTPSENIIEMADGISDLESSHIVRKLPVLVLSPHNRCNCRCLMCDIWKIQQTRAITALDLAPHIESLHRFKVRWVVFSGGEPLLHADLEGLCEQLRREGIRVTLLTAGLILERFAQTVAKNVDDLIISLDGPRPVHDEIRNVPRAFGRLAEGIAAVRKVRPAMSIAARCTVQKKNFRHLRSTVDTARHLRLNSISFLSADVTSGAFNRPEGWPEDRQASIALDESEVECLAEEIEALIHEYRNDIDSGFVVENATKLQRIVLHFRAHLGHGVPVAPRCNAPWVSAVVEADGTVRPCFFHPPVGNIHRSPLHEIINSPEALAFRSTLTVSSNPICKKCVCPLFIAQLQTS